MKPRNPRLTPPGRLLTIKDVAEHCRVSPRTVMRWIDGGQLSIFKFGRAVRISEDDLRIFLDLSKK